MNLENTHPELEGKHAVFSASKHSWINYDDAKLVAAYISSYSSTIGTLVHAYAKDKIIYRQPLEDNKSERNALMLHLLKNDIPTRVIAIDTLFYNLMPYVNDAIGFKMTPELRLYYSDYCFGTADAVSYYRNTLRIHDLKTGSGQVSMDQLMIYAGLFFLQFKKDVNLQKSKVELRIYQNQDIITCNPSISDIETMIGIIQHATAVVDKDILEA